MEQDAAVAVAEPEIAAPPATRVNPWRRLGADVTQAMTVDEALEEAGLTWNVIKVPTLRQIPAEAYEVLHPAPGPDNPDNRPEILARVNGDVIIPSRERFEIRRDETHKMLGIVGPDYEPFQNRQAFQFAYDLIDMGEATPDTMGDLRGGKWVWLNLKLPREIVVAGDESKIDLNLGIATSHDGSKAITAFVNMIRIVCENTLNAAIGTAVTKWSIRHIGTLEGRLMEARQALELSFAYADEFQELGNWLADQTFTPDEFERLADKLITKQPRVNEALKAHYHASTTVSPALKQTRWGAYNLVTEFFDWGRDNRDPHAQVMSTWTGTAARARNATISLLKQDVVPV